MVADHPGNSSISVNGKVLPKLPSDKDEWILSYKKIIRNLANTLQINGYLQGYAIEPDQPPVHNNVLTNLQLQKNYREEKEKFDRKAALAWQFIFDISYETPVQEIIIPFEETRDSSAAWQAIIDHYELDLGGSQRQILERKLNSAHPDLKLTDIKLMFRGLVNKINQITTALDQLPAPLRLTLDEHSKLNKLQDAMLNRSSGKFETIMLDSTTNVNNYAAFITAVETLIDRDQKISSMKKVPTASSIKTANEKNENGIVPALKVVTFDEDLKNCDAEDLKALKADWNKNGRRITRAIKRLEKPSESSDDDKRSNHRNNRSSERRERHPNSFQNPSNWRGGRRRDEPRGQRGGRFSGRGRDDRRNSYDDSRSSYNQSSSSNNTNSNNRDGRSYSSQNNSYYGSDGRRGRYGGYGRGRGGRDGRGGRGYGGRYQGRGYNQEYYNTQYTQYNQPYPPFHANQASTVIPGTAPTPAVPFPLISPFPPSAPHQPRTY